MKLTHILRQVQEDATSNYVPWDKWKLSETDYLHAIGFTPNGDYTMELKNPKMKAYKTKEGMFLQENDKTSKFPDFKGLMEYFDNYKQESD